MIEKFKGLKMWQQGLIILVVFSIIISPFVEKPVTVTTSYVIPATPEVPSQAEVTEEIPAETYNLGPNGIYTVGTDIPAGTYDLQATGSGSGNVIIDSQPRVNTIMCSVNDSGIDGFCESTYDNVKLRRGDTIDLRGVSIDFVGEAGTVVVQEATEAIPAVPEQTVIEELTVDPDGKETCKFNGVRAECSELQEYETLSKEAKITK